MEREIDNATVKFFGVTDEQKKSILTAERQTLGRKMEFLKVVASVAIKNQKAQASFKLITDDADSVVADRNKLIHGQWKQTSISFMRGRPRVIERAVKISFRAQGRLTSQEMEFSPTQVMDIAEQALGVSDRLKNFFDVYPTWATPPASQNKP